MAKISQVGPRHVEAIDLLADEIDTPEHLGGLVYIDTSARGWAIEVTLTFRSGESTTIVGSLEHLRNLARQLPGISGRHRRAALALARKIDAGIAGPS